MGLLSQFSSKAEMHRRETIKRFDDFIETYLSALKDFGKPSMEELTVTLVARSPESAVAAAVQRHGERFSMNGCDLRLIFISLEPAPEFSDFVDTLISCNGEARGPGSVRWARNEYLIDAHEQLVLGQRQAWTGDCMRRAADIRHGLDLFSKDGDSSVLLARQAFEGLWGVSQDVPRARFRTAAAVKQKGPEQLEAVSDMFGDIPFASDAVTRH